jgi:hypothetical protein
VAIEPTGRRPEHRAHHWARLLLLIPFIAVLWVPFYDSVEPMLFGVPFFYWYQLLWIILSALLIVIVYRAEH